jgi:hypothetical protein
MNISTLMLHNSKSLTAYKLQIMYFVLEIVSLHSCRTILIIESVRAQKYKQHICTQRVSCIYVAQFKIIDNIWATKNVYCTQKRIFTYVLHSSKSLTTYELQRTYIVLKRESLHMCCTILNHWQCMSYKQHI